MKKLTKQKPDQRELVTISKDMPRATEAESAILSCILDNPKLLNNPLPEHYFYPEDGSNRIIYSVMLEMSGNQMPVEYVALSQRLADKGLLDRIGGHGYMAELLDFQPAPEHYRYYSSILRDKHVARQAVIAGTEIIEAALGHQDDVGVLAATCTQSITRISDSIRGKKKTTLNDQIDDWMDNWQDINAGKRAAYSATRWPEWNAKVMGMAPGYVVISGPRGSGKSTLGQNIFTDMIFNHGKAGIFCSYEMSARMVLNRIIADIGNVHSGYLFAPDITKPDGSITRTISACIDRIRASGLEIVHDVRMGMDELAMLARDTKSRKGSCVVLCDYIQLVPPPRLAKDANREQEVAQNSAILRSLSKELDEVVIGLSQINMDGTTRESSSIEADSDFVARVERYKQKDGTTTEGGINITKNRSGPEGFKIPLVLQGQHYRFSDTTSMFPE